MGTKKVHISGRYAIIAAIITAGAGYLSGGKIVENKLNNQISQSINIDGMGYENAIEYIVNENKTLEKENKILQDEINNLKQGDFVNSEQSVVDTISSIENDIIDVKLSEMMYSEYIYDSATYRVSNEIYAGTEYKNALCFDFDMNGGYGGNLAISYSLNKKYNTFTGNIIPKSIYVDPFQKVHAINIKIYADDTLIYDINIGDTTESQALLLDVKNVDTIKMEMQGVNGSIILSGGGFI